VKRQSPTIIEQYLLSLHGLRHGECFGCFIFQEQPFASSAGLGDLTLLLLRVVQALGLADLAGSAVAIDPRGNLAGKGVKQRGPSIGERCDNGPSEKVRQSARQNTSRMLPPVRSGRCFQTRSASGAFPVHRVEKS